MSLRTRLTPALAVLGSVTVLALAVNTASVAAGGPGLLLGHTNKVASQTTLTRTKPGPALALKTKTTASAPFTTNATGKVAHLNADKIDGFDSPALVNSALAYSATLASATTTAYITIPTPTLGTYLVNYNGFFPGGSGNSYCQLVQANPVKGTTQYAAVAQVGDTDSPGLSGSGVVRIIEGDTLQLQCASETAFVFYASSPLQVELIPTSAPLLPLVAATSTSKSTSTRLAGGTR